ncbi:MAG: hypothetical protein ACREYE_12800 [Gammaproteobacteria bacterium]
MPNLPQIALIAVRMAPGPRTSEPQAIVIGTKAPWGRWNAGEDWRYACYPLSRLRELLKDRPCGELEDDLFEPRTSQPERAEPDAVLAESMKKPTGLLTSFDRQILGSLGFTQEYLNKRLTIPVAGGQPRKPTRWQIAIPLRDVERVFFFSYKNSVAVKNCFAALDCARYVEPAETSTVPHAFHAAVPNDSVPTGSRIIVFPDFTDPSRPGALSAVAVYTSIKVAINGHRLV